MKKFIMLVLSALTCLCFVACAPKTVEKAKEKMEAAGYSVELISEDVAEIGLGEEAEGSIIATKTEGGLLNLKTYILTAVLFDSTKAAKEYYEQTLENSNGDTGITRSGKWVVVGNVEAIDEFMK